jgi:hypothetical protein
MVKALRPVSGANPAPVTVTEVPTGPDVGLKVIAAEASVNVAAGDALVGVSTAVIELLDVAVVGTVNTAVNAPLASGVANTVVTPLNLMVTSPSIPGTQPLPLTVIVLPL